MTEPLLPNSVLPPPQRQVASSSHVHTLPPVPMRFRSNYEVAEPTWENGHPVMHELSGLLPPAHQKPTWVRAHETLESIVQQATGRQRQKSNFMMMMPQDHTPTSISSTVAPSNGRTAMPPERSGQEQSEPSPPARKRVRSDSGDIGNYCLEECAPSSGGCASISATFCRSFKRSKTLEDDSPSLCESENQDQEEDRDTNKEETGRSNSTRRNRAAAVHNQSEQRRRDRINQKLKALQRLVPKASKNDKASILDEVIEYLKQLQAQIQMMSMRNMPQQMMMMMMQQQLQMSMMARMGFGLGSGSGQGPGLAGLLNANTTMAARPPVLASIPQLTVAAAPAITPSFMMSPLVQAHAPPPPPPKPEPASATTSNASVSLPDPYATFLSQSVNMDILSNMEALYRQQMRQNNRNMSSLLQQQHHGQGN